MFVLKVKSHLSQEGFLEKHGEDLVWMFHVNQRTDQLRSTRAASLVNSAINLIHAWMDGHTEKLLRYQMGVLESVQGLMSPRPQKSKEARANESFCRVLDGSETGHVWESRISGALCVNCGLKLPRTLTLDKMLRLSARRCLALGGPRSLLEWFVHPCHELVLRESQWACRLCCRKGPLTLFRRWQMPCK